MNNQWQPCAIKPEVAKNVLIWHRARPWCRFYKPVVGWWNGKEWRRDFPWFLEQTRDHGLIYQPKCWKYIEEPETAKPKEK